MTKQYKYFIDSKLLAYYLVQRKGSILEIYNKIAQLLWDLPKGEIYVAFDVGKSSYRTSIYSQYKGHRAKAKEKKSPQELLDNKKFEEDYIKLIDFTKELNVHVLAVQGVEADDLISIKVQELKDDPNNVIYLVTGDMDYVNSVVGTDNVCIINALQNGDIIGHDEVLKKYGEDMYSRDRFNIHKSIFGDRSDNIKFLRNFGAVKAQEVFNAIFEKTLEPSTEDILEEINKVIQRYSNIKVHENHEADGRLTIEEAFNANMLLADTFRDTSLMDKGQLVQYLLCQERVPPKEAQKVDLILKSYELFGENIDFSYKAEKVFNIK